MNKATFTPAVTETKTVEVEPAKVTLELTPEAAGKLKALVGHVSSRCNFGLYDVLDKLGSQLPKFNAVPAYSRNLGEELPAILLTPA